MTDFPQKPDIAATEARWRAAWAEDPAFRWDPALPPEDDFAIDTPPPTVSGVLHVGHVYSYTQADIIARFWRMRGKNVLYPIGWDDNGLPTERLVEKVRKVRAGTMDREAFVALCREVIPEYHARFRDLFSRIALAVDWSREYSTISDEARAISQLSFVDLFEKGLLERRLEPALWDPADRTAIAQAEVEDSVQMGRLNRIAFGVEGGGEVEIATTRPELLSGCAAMMIHPDHPRAGELVGRRAITPLYQVPVPIIADDGVDPEKGTGVVMCCTFGDVADIGWWRAHRLPLRIVLEPTGRMKETLPIGTGDWPSLDPAGAERTVAALAGLKVGPAREKILELLAEDGALRGQEEREQIVPVAERSGAALEIIVTPQWNVRTLDFKEQLLAKGREIDWYPAHMRARFENWVEGLKWDWTISRQRHFGVPLPVWYSKRAGEEGRILLPTQDQLPVDPRSDLPAGYARDEVEAETDVMDTWATSANTPQLITRQISPERGHDAQAHQRLFPMRLRPQAHDIIRTWAFYTIVKALHHQGEVPWREITISGWCLAADGSKMSKSKGNVIDPIKLLDEYGTDAVRYWTGTSRLGADTAISPNTLKQGKRLVTKLWNAARLAHMSLDGHELAAVSPRADVAAGIITHPLDLWVLGQLSTTVQKATAAFEAYEYAQALRLIEDFFWHVHTDNYLELVKHRARVEPGQTPDAAQRSALHTLLHLTRGVLRLYAPFTPFVTEELAQHFRLLGEAGSIHARGTWPAAADHLDPDTGAEVGQCTLGVLAAARKVKAALKVSMRAEVARLAIDRGPALPEGIDLAACIAPVMEDLKATTAAEEIVIGPVNGGETAAPSNDDWLQVELTMA